MLKNKKNSIKYLILFAFFIFSLCLPLTVSAVTVSYTYDKLNRLEQVIYSEGSKINIIEYTYDNVGNMSTTTTIFQGIDSENILSLINGWNLTSIPDISTNISVQEAYGPILSSIINIWVYENGTWRVYPPYPGYNTLTEIKPWQGLWLNMRNNETVSFMPKTFNNVYLAKGWNLVRFTLPESLNIPDAISSIYGNVVSIWTYQDGKWMVYDPLNPYLSDLTTLEPGPGYWIRVNNSCLWTH